MEFISCYNSSKAILMEGALGERLKREFNIKFDDDVAMASLVYDDNGRKALIHIWTEYMEIAEKYNLPFLATTPTRRANQDRVNQSKFNASIIKDNVELLKELRRKSSISNMFIGGLMGCKGDAYKATEVLSVTKAKQFHYWQAELFERAHVDFLYAGIMPALSEAIGMAQAMQETGLPYIISFMIRKDGRLIDGTTISDAINRIDDKVIQKPVCYMTNCVHPKVLQEAFSFNFNKTYEVKSRFKGIQANTSPLSPEELDHSIDLKCSDAVSLASLMVELSKYIDTKIYGGCCGTNSLHIEEIAKRINHKNSE